MKKITAVITAVSIALCSLCAYAEEDKITVEAEDFAAENAMFTSENGAAVVNLSPSGTSPELIVTVKVQESGVYSFVCASSALMSEKTSDYYIELNGLHRLSPSETEKGDGISSNYGGIYKYTYPDVNLKAGINTLKFIVECDDYTSSDMITAAFDYCEFIRKEAEFEPVSFEFEDNCFYSNDDITLNVRFSGYADSIRTYCYIAENADGAPQRMGSFTVENGEDIGKIVMTGVPVGWYRVKIYTYGFEEYTGLSTEITVTHPVKTAPGIAATDFAANNLLTGNITDFKKLEKRLEKAGIKNVRERVGWRTANGSSTNYDNVLKIYEKDGINTNAVYASAISGKKDFSENLLDVYEMNRLQAQELPDGTLFEIWNEQDGSFAASTGDMYAAYFKAAAIGISDGNSNSSKAMGGFAWDAGMFFTKLLMQNDVLSYADAYLHHTHTGYSGSDIHTPMKNPTVSHMETKSAYEPKMPMYINEAGFSINKNNLNDKSRNAQAGFYLTQLSQLTAAGEDRVYFFTWPYYPENGSAFGVFSEDLLPKQVFAAIAAANGVLGNAIYCGRLANLPEKAEGYMFSDGERDIAVIWSSEDSRWQVHTKKELTITDYQGRTAMAYTTSDGLANIAISKMPVLVSFEGLSDLRNYYPHKHVKTELTKKQYSMNERIVIRQLWDGESLGEAKTKGYYIGEGEQQGVTVEVYNFNDEGALVELDIVSEGSFETNIDNMMLFIPPMQKKSFDFIVNAGVNIRPGETGYIRIGGMLDDEQLSPSIAYVSYDNSGRTLSEVMEIPEAQNLSNWNTGNRTSGSTVICSQVSGGVTFDYNLPDTSSYAYPTFSVNETVLSGTDGISFEITMDDSYSSAGTDVFVYTDEGSFHIDAAAYLPLIAGTHKHYITWKELVRWSGNGTLRPENIRSIAIGLQGRGDVPAYTITGICGFVSDAENDKQKKNVEFLNVESDAVCKQDSISVLMPKAKYESVKVLLNGYSYSDWERNGEDLSVSVSELERGYYSIQIVGTDAMNSVDTSSVGFYIE